MVAIAIKTILDSRDHLRAPGFLMVEPGLGARSLRNLGIQLEGASEVTWPSSDPQPGDFLLRNARLSNSSPTHSFPSFRIPNILF